MRFTFFFFPIKFHFISAEKTNPFSLFVLLCKHTFFVGGEMVNLSEQNSALVLIQQLPDSFSTANCRAPGTATEILGL